MVVHLQIGELPKSWRVKTHSFKKVNMSRVQSRADVDELPIVDDDIVWNYALDDFEVGGHNGQESLVGDESNPENVAQLLKMDTIGVSKPDITLAFVSNAMALRKLCELVVLLNSVANVGVVGSMPTSLNTLTPMPNNFGTLTIGI
jgi:hypothetical protein